MVLAVGWWQVDLRKLFTEGRLQVVLVGMKNMPEPFQVLPPNHPWRRA